MSATSKSLDGTVVTVEKNDTTSYPVSIVLDRNGVGGPTLNVTQSELSAIIRAARAWGLS